MYSNNNERNRVRVLREQVSCLLFVILLEKLVVGLPAHVACVWAKLVFVHTAVATEREDGIFVVSGAKPCNDMWL